MVDTIKFSQMTSGGDIENNDSTPGLKSGGNVLFNNPWTFLPPGTTAQRPAPSSAINYRLRFNTDNQIYEYYDATTAMWTQLQESAFTVGPFVTYTADASLPDAQNLGLLANGILKQTITTGIATLNIAVNGTDFYGPGFIIPVVSGGTGVNSVTITPTATSFAGWDSNRNFSSNNFNAGYTQIITSGATTTLTVGSTYQQYFIGVSSQTITMPVTSTLALGMSWQIVNLSTGTLTIQSSGGNTITTVGANSSTRITCILTSGTSAASWSAQTPIAGSGVVSPGTINQLAYYAATGSTVSGLATANSAMLYTNSSGIPAWSASMTNGQVMIGSTGGSPVPAALVAGTGVMIANAANSITISVTGSGMSWTEIVGTSQTMVADNGYVANNAGLVTLTLPTTAAFGTVISVCGKGAGGWRIAQNANQSIRFGSSTTTVGVGGSLASTISANSIDILCTTANLVWTVQGAPQGIITVV